MKKNFMSENELINLINNAKGCQFVGIEYSTDKESLNKKLQGGKKNTYYDKVSCITSMTAQMGASYENAVNNRIDDENPMKGEFVAEKLPWGQWVKPNYIIEHKGTFYIRLYMVKTSNVTKTYFFDGNKADEATSKDIQQNIREHATSNRQAEVGIAEERQAKPFNVKVASIEQFTYNGKTYTINHKVG